MLTGYANVVSGALQAMCAEREQIGACVHQVLCQSVRESSHTSVPGNHAALQLVCWQHQYGWSMKCLNKPLAALRATYAALRCSDF